MRKQIMGVMLASALLIAGGAMALTVSAEEEKPAFKVPEPEHHYQLQDDSYEATDTEGGYRHYVCADCGEERRKEYITGIQHSANALLDGPPVRQGWEEFARL